MFFTCIFWVILYWWSSNVFFLPRCWCSWCIYLYIAILRVKVLNKVQQKHGLFKIILALLCIVGIIKPDFCNREHCPNTFSSFKDMIVRNMEGWKTKMETLLAILANRMLSLLLISHEYHSRSNEQQAVKLNYNVEGFYKIKRKYIRLYSTT